MSNLLFPAYALTENNQALLETIAREYGVYRREDESLTVERVLDAVYYNYVYDNRVIRIELDEYDDFGEITTELFKQRIPYDVVHCAEYDSNSAVEFYRDYMEESVIVNTDAYNNPMLSVDTIRSIIDSQDEGLTDLEVMDKLVARINEYDFAREGNRIQDVA